MDQVIGGLELLFTPLALLWLVIGLVLGFVVGVLPGLSSSNTAALLLPLALLLPTEVGLILIVSIYAGVQFGGAIPGILLNMPGDAGAAVTAIDGYPMTQQGRGGEAIGVARMASTFGGVLSGVIVLLLLGPIGALALSFGAREMTIVVIMGLLVASALIGQSVRKGLFAGSLGLLLATVGAAPATGQPRFSGGLVELYDGISFIATLIGLFAVSELLLIMRRKNIERPAVTSRVSFRKEMRDVVAGVVTTLRHWRIAVQSTFVGLLFGVVPGGGTAVSSFLAYSLAKRRSKTPEKFGTGFPGGVVASEANDNAVTSAAMAPTLTLGIPGSATGAVVLAALYMQGIQPGPQIMQTHGEQAYAVILALILASLLIMPFGVLLATPLTWIIRVPVSYLVPVVLMVCIAGSYVESVLVFNVGVALLFGVIGYAFRRADYPIIPVVLGMVLGPLLERNLLRALDLGGNDIGYFFDSPVAIVLWLLLLALGVYLFWKPQRGRARRPVLAGPAAPAEREDER